MRGERADAGCPSIIHRSVCFTDFTHISIDVPNSEKIFIFLAFSVMMLKMLLNLKNECNINHCYAHGDKAVEAYFI